MAEFEEGAGQEFQPADQDDETPEYSETPEPEEDDDIVSKYDLGCYGAWWASPEKTYLKEDIEDDVLHALVSLRQMASRSDIAARRFEVEQTWESSLFERGYQHLTGRKGGGFDLPGQDTRWGPTAQINRANLLNTNILSKTCDIIVGALCREVPRVQFLPSCPQNNPEVTAAQVADKFKFVYQRNTNIRGLMRKVSKLFCTDDRVIAFTYFRMNGSEYGFVGDQPEAVSPENETSEMGTSNILEQLLNAGTEDQDGQISDDTPEPEEPQPIEEEAPKAKKQPKGIEYTELFGKLENKVPITAKCREDMPWLQLFTDLDEALVKAMFPFAAKRIKPEGVDSAEIELDRIARMNTNLAIQGKYVTGDSMQRLCTVCITFMRPSWFYANEVREEIRDKLIELFPDGCVVITAGSEFIFARNCAMNDHVAIAHPLDEPGQNRRALLTNVMPIQKRLNDWMDLMGDFFVRTVPKRYYDQTAFDIALIQSQDNVPGGSIPFLARPGVAFSQLMGTDPSVTPQPNMGDFIKWFEGSLNDDISGALASLYGGATDINTAAGMAIQRDQALGRMNSAWNAIQEMFAETHRQAVKCAAKNRDNDIDESIQGVGRITVEIAKMRGNVLCYPEYDASFPESSQQKLARWEKLWESVKDNPASEQFLNNLKSMKALKDNLRFTEIEINGVAEYEKQQGEFEILIKSGPIPNPEIDKLKTQILEHHTQIMTTTEGMKQDALNNSLNPQDVQQAAPKMDQMEQQVELMAQQIQQLEKDWPLVSTVPIREDKSENHVAEASAVYDWMNGVEGRRYAHGTPEEQEIFMNFYLHWKKHVEVDGNLNPKSANFKSEGLSFTLDLSKAPPDIAAQVLSAGGFQAQANSFQQQSDQVVKDTIQTRTAPHVLRKLTRS